MKCDKIWMSIKYTNYILKVNNSVKSYVMTASDYLSVEANIVKDTWILYSMSIIAPYHCFTEKFHNVKNILCRCKYLKREEKFMDFSFKNFSKSLVLVNLI